MTLTELAKKVDRTLTFMSFVKNGKRTVGKNLSIELERVTGISWTKWLRPEKYGSPWRQLEKLKKFKGEG